MKEKERSRTILAGILAICLGLTMSIPAFAAEDDALTDSTSIGLETETNTDDMGDDFNMNLPADGDYEGQSGIIEDSSIISDKQTKEELIMDFTTVIAYVEEMEESNTDMNVEEGKIEITAEKLGAMDTEEIEKTIEEAVKEIAQNKNCYFLETGVDLVKRYCPELLNDIQTEAALEKKETTLLGEGDFITTQRARYSKAHTWAYCPLSGKPLIKETIRVSWDVKNYKITGVDDPTLTFTFDPRYYKVVKTFLEKKTIASDKKSATVETKVRYKNKLSPFSIFHRYPSAKVKYNGKVTFYQAK